MLCGGLRFQRKSSSSPYKFLPGHANTMDQLSRKFPLLIGLFGFISCQKVEEDLDHMLWSCEFARLVWDCIF